MDDERCALCAEAGFPDVLAHYKAVKKAVSLDGKDHPALCWDHQHGKIPKWILEAQAKKNGKPIEVKASDGKCGCGRELPHKGRCAARRATVALAKVRPPALAVRAKHGRPGKLMSLSETLQNLRGLLEVQRAEIVKNMDAVDIVLQLVARAEKSNSAAEFFGKRGA